MAAFVLRLSMEENKGEGKQAEDEGVFLRFGDDGAPMKAQLHRAVATSL